MILSVNGDRRQHLAALLAATALAVPVAAQDEALMLGQCEVRNELPDRRPRAIDYQMVEPPAGSKTEIGVLFLYTDRFTSQRVSARLDAVRYANSMFEAGTSGVRLKIAGVEPAPASLSRLDDGSASAFRAILEKAQALDATLRVNREAVGGDVVVVMAESRPGYCGGGIAEIFLTSTAGMRSKAYAVVGMRTDQIVTCDYQAGLSLAHEVGHLLGLHHDAATIDADQGTGSAARWRDSGHMHDSRGFGYLNPTPLGPDEDGAQQYAGTVMAYSQGAYNLHGFSRPGGALTVARYGVGQTLDGGDSTTHADIALRKTAATVAGFYTAATTPDPDPEPDPDPNPPPTGGQCTLPGGAVFDCHTTAAGHLFGVSGTSTKASGGGPRSAFAAVTAPCSISSGRTTWRCLPKF